MNFFDYHHYYLVGIKGVAMTSLAQLLLDANKTVSGSDVPEAFVTQPLLDKLSVAIDESFDVPLSETIECVVYTAAHHGKLHPQVQQAINRGIPVYSQAEALGFFFNQKKGIAVCGVGGKSTVSAMITWILEKSTVPVSFSVGVGNIIGLDKTGQWKSDSELFVAEADEYVTDPAAIQQGEAAIPRFSYLKPFVTVCTHLKFDHPDVYKDEAHTFKTFNTFFSQIKPQGSLIINEDDTSKVESSLTANRKTFGKSSCADLQYTFLPANSQQGITAGVFSYMNSDYSVRLQVPGEYNLENAAAATLACLALGISIEECINALSSFQSTSRRFEKLGEWKTVPIYDDYAHHPTEIKAVLAALKSWYPTSRKVVAFQPHTFSRTKALFEAFVESFRDSDVVLLLDIFASAREQSDSSISTKHLVDAVKQLFPEKEVHHLNSPATLAEFCSTFLKTGDVLLTVGAGDIYTMFEYLTKTQATIEHIDQTSFVSNQAVSLVKTLRQQFPNIDFKTNHPLAQYTTVKIGGPAEVFCQLTNKQDIIDVVLFANSHTIPITMLGWGANSLISDQGINGLVIKNSSQIITIHDEHSTEQAKLEHQKVDFTARWQASAAPEAPSYEFDDLDYSEESVERILVTMDAGVSMPAAINTLLAKGVTGLQWYSRIPATVGGAIYNNIHGGTHFIGEIISAVEVLTKANKIQRYTVDQLNLAYDYSRFHYSDEIILSADFLLYKGNVQKAQTVAFEWAKRKHIQPQNSLGCVFQNISPEDQQRLNLPTPSIGYLIQHVLQLKGYQVGDAKISDKHAAFIENVGSATADDYVKIIKNIIFAAQEKCGITLQTEIFFLGFTEDQLTGIVHSRSKKSSASA